MYLNFIIGVEFDYSLNTRTMINITTKAINTLSITLARRSLFFTHILLFELTTIQVLF